MLKGEIIIVLMIDVEDALKIAGDSVAQQLSMQARKLRNLRELRALKVANESLKNEIELIQARIEQTQGEVLKLLGQIEYFSGNHETLRDEILAVRRAVRPPESFEAIENAA